MAAANGLGRERALRAVTLDAANLLGIADRFGSIDYLQALSGHCEACPELELVVSVGQTGPDAAAFADLLHDVPLHAASRADPDEPLVIGFTSGTTADPKGVVHTHRSLLAELRQLSLLRPRGRPILMAAPISHFTGMLGGLLMRS